MFECSIFDELLNRYHENKLAHAFLLETNDIKKCHDDLIKFIKIICKKDEDSNVDYLIDNGNFPGLMDIFPDGTQIKKVQVKEIMDRFSSIPVFSDYNIYIINECEVLNVASANSLLKFLEEPTDNIIGFYITSNKMNVISTIRSRCQEYSAYYEVKNDYSDYLEKIESYFNNVYKNNNAILYNKEEGIKYFEDRKEWINYFNNVIVLFYDVLTGKKVNINLDLLKDFDNEKLIKLIDLIQTILKYLQSNGNIELILDKLVIEMRNIYE